MALGFRHIFRTARYLKSCKFIQDIETLIKVPKNRIMDLSFDPKYNHFSVPKRNGDLRKIEEPSGELKIVLKKLNFVLQCVYFFEQPQSSYGFILSHKGNKSPKNIFTNAQRHINAKFMVNVDFKDFFHQISKKTVFDTFHRYPFHLNKDAAYILSSLCTYKGRLAMGSPTSPVLSNFASILLDLKLENWCEKKNIVYTRFVDDLTFSSEKELDMVFLFDLRQILNGFSIQINEDKTKFFTPNDTKIVTGLEVTDKVSVPGRFIFDLDQDIKRLKNCIEAKYQTIGTMKNEFIDTFSKHVSGRIAFLQMVSEPKNKKMLDLIRKYEDALIPNFDKLSIRWTDFPYHFK